MSRTSENMACILKTKSHNIISYVLLGIYSPRNVEYVLNIK